MLCRECKENNGHYEGAFEFCQNPTPDDGACMNPNYWGPEFVTYSVLCNDLEPGFERKLYARHKNFNTCGEAVGSSHEGNEPELRLLALVALKANVAEMKSAIKEIREEAKSANFGSYNTKDLPPWNDVRMEQALMLHQSQADGRGDSAAPALGSFREHSATLRGLKVGDTVHHKSYCISARATIGVVAAVGGAYIDVNWLAPMLMTGIPIWNLERVTDHKVLARTLRIGDRLVFPRPKPLSSWLEVRSIHYVDGEPAFYHFLGVDVPWTVEEVHDLLDGKLNAELAHAPKIVRKEVLDKLEAQYDPFEGEVV